MQPGSGMAFRGEVRPFRSNVTFLSCFVLPKLEWLSLVEGLLADVERMELKLLGSRNENMPLKDKRDASADERHLRAGNDTLGDKIAG